MSVSKSSDGKTIIRVQLSDQRNKQMIEDDKDRNRLSNNKRTQEEERRKPQQIKERNTKNTKQIRKPITIRKQNSKAGER